MIWCNKSKTNFINKIFKFNTKEVKYLKKLIERENLDEKTVNLINEFLEINNNFDLEEFIKKQDFFEFNLSDDFIINDFSKNKDNVAYAINEAILALKYKD